MESVEVRVVSAEFRGLESGRGGSGTMVSVVARLTVDDGLRARKEPEAQTGICTGRDNGGVPFKREGGGGWMGLPLPPPTPLGCQVVRGAETTFW